MHRALLFLYISVFIFIVVRLQHYECFDNNHACAIDTCTFFSDNQYLRCPVTVCVSLIGYKEKKRNVRDAIMNYQ